MLIIIERIMVGCIAPFYEFRRSAVLAAGVYLSPISGAMLMLSNLKM